MGPDTNVQATKICWCLYPNKPKKRTQKNKRSTQLKGEERDGALEQADLRDSEIFSLEMVESQNTLQQNGPRGIIEIIKTEIIKTQPDQAVSDLP